MNKKKKKLKKLKLNCRFQTILIAENSKNITTKKKSHLAILVKLLSIGFLFKTNGKRFEITIRLFLNPPLFSLLFSDIFSLLFSDIFQIFITKVQFIQKKTLLKIIFKINKFLVAGPNSTEVIFKMSKNIMISIVVIFL